MPAIARGGDAITTGHLCDVVSTILTGVTTGDISMVFANGIGVACVGDKIAPHTIGTPPACVPHVAVINVGSGTVFVGGKAVARIGDSADAGVITAGSGNVNAG
jgi:uncharacterized Zn-binding protein involved in type VI secretion